MRSSMEECSFPFFLVGGSHKLPRKNIVANNFLRKICLPSQCYQPFDCVEAIFFHGRRLLPVFVICACMLIRLANALRVHSCRIVHMHKGARADGTKNWFWGCCISLDREFLEGFYNYVNVV